MSNQEKLDSIQLTPDEIQSKIRRIDEQIAKKTASLIKDNQGNTLNRERNLLKWFVYVLAGLITASIITAALLTALPSVLVGSVIVGAMGLALLNYAYHAIDRMRTVGRGVAFVGTTATVALLAEHVQDTSLLSQVGALLMPISFVAGISAFLSNIVLYRNDVPQVLQQLVDSLKFDNWHKPNALKAWFNVFVTSVIDLAIMVTALVTGYFLTAGMVHCFIHLFTLSIFGVSVLSAPYVVAPLFFITFLGNGTFMQRALNRIKEHLITAWQYDCDGWTTASPLKRMTYYFLAWSPTDSNATKAVKTFTAFIKLGVVAAVAYFSQVPMVRALLTGVQWASNIVIFSWLLPLIKAMTLQSMIARVAITVEKVTVVTNKIIAAMPGLVFWLKFKCTPKANRDETIAQQYDDLTKNRLTYREKCHLYILDDDAQSFWKDAFGDNWRHYYKQQSEYRWQQAAWYLKLKSSVKGTISHIVDYLMIPAIFFSGCANGVLSFDGESHATSTEKALALFFNTFAFNGIAGESYSDSKKRKDADFTDAGFINNIPSKSTGNDPAFFKSPSSIHNTGNSNQNSLRATI